MRALSVGNPRTLVVGLLFVLVAVVGFTFALGYQPGTAARMGPGFFPRLVTLLLGLVGAAVAIGSLRRRAEGPTDGLEPWDLRSLGWVLGAVILFGLAAVPLGFPIALVALVLVASRASPEFTWAGALAATAVLVGLCLLIFVWGLGMPFPVWPPVLG